MDENKRKHLEFLQNVITRMNSNSFLIKGWAITLVSALFALAAKDAEIKYVIITYFSVPIFWALDAYYLSLERQYRRLYELVSVTPDAAIDFSMNASNFNQGRNTWSRSMSSRVVWPIYITILGITGFIMYFFQSH